MADWLKPCQHICVALATVDWTKADHWIQMLEKLWCACAMAILFKEQVLFFYEFMEYSHLSANRLSFLKWAGFKWLLGRPNCVRWSFSWRFDPLHPHHPLTLIRNLQYPTYKSTLCCSTCKTQSRKLAKHFLEKKEFGIIVAVISHMKMLSQNLRFLLACNVACKTSPKKNSDKFGKRTLSKESFWFTAPRPRPLLWAWAVWTCGHAVLRFAAFPLASVHDAMSDG